MATKTAPGRMRRESYSIPVTGAAESLDAPTAFTSAMRSFHNMTKVIVAAEATVSAWNDISNNRPGICDRTAEQE